MANLRCGSIPTTGFLLKSRGTSLLSCAILSPYQRSKYEFIRARRYTKYRNFLVFTLQYLA
jgi:hypothetical protein